jgi:hypothetical protein
MHQVESIAQEPSLLKCVDFHLILWIKRLERNSDDAPFQPKRARIVTVVVWRRMIVTNEVICNIPLCARRSNECQLESALSYYATMYKDTYHQMKLPDPRLVCQSETRTHIGLHSRELMKAMYTPGSCQEWGKVKVESRMFWIQFTNWLYTLLLSIIHRYPWLMDEDMLNSSEITSQEDSMTSWFCKRRQHWKLNLCFKSVYKSCDKSIPRIPQEFQGWL